MTEIYQQLVGRDEDRNGPYKLDDQDQFTVPGVGTFRLDLEGRCIQLVAWEIAKLTLSSKIYPHLLDPESSIATNILRHIIDPEVKAGIFERFEDFTKLHDHVPRIAELSRSMTAQNGAAPRFVLEVGARGHDDEIKSAVETALRGHGVDAYIHMV